MSRAVSIFQIFVTIATIMLLKHAWNRLPQDVAILRNSRRAYDRPYVFISWMVIVLFFVGVLWFEVWIWKAYWAASRHSRGGSFIQGA